MPFESSVGRSGGLDDKRGGEKVLGGGFDEKASFRLGEKRQPYGDPSLTINLHP